MSSGVHGCDGANAASKALPPRVTPSRIVQGVDEPDRNVFSNEIVYTDAITTETNMINTQSLRIRVCGL